MSIYLAAEAIGQHEGFGLNPNILETNLINIVIILAVLVYFGRGIVGNILSQRLTKIQTAIAEAEQRQAKAAEQLAIQQEKLAQTQAECDRLLAKAKQDAEQVRAQILAGVSGDIEKLKLAAQREIDTEQERAIAQLREQVVVQSLAKVNAYFDQGLSESAQTQLIDRSLSLFSVDRS
ncbi:MAG: F0F1 ATP synthase subunit B [Pseudanabaenaceae cyanobacterium bins.68]|nr:F0F1 ATP synthase subunit B [Pseudanabaenaceae cyanobacterium bins.68]